MINLNVVTLIVITNLEKAYDSNYDSLLLLDVHVHTLFLLSFFLPLSLEGRKRKGTMFEIIKVAQNIDLGIS